MAIIQTTIAGKTERVYKEFDVNSFLAELKKAITLKSADLAWVAKDIDTIAKNILES